MKNIALVVIDLQNDITKNYKMIIGQVNEAIDWAVANEMHIIYIKHYNLSEKTRTFKPETNASHVSALAFDFSKTLSVTKYLTLFKSYFLRIPHGTTESTSNPSLCRINNCGLYHLSLYQETISVPFFCAKP